MNKQKSKLYNIQTYIWILTVLSCNGTIDPAFINIGKSDKTTGNFTQPMSIGTPPHNSKYFSGKYIKRCIRYCKILYD